MLGVFLIIIVIALLGISRNLTDIKNQNKEIIELLSAEITVDEEDD